jgi:hypothetical protein
MRSNPLPNEVDARTLIRDVTAASFAGLQPFFTALKLLMGCCLLVWGFGVFTCRDAHDFLRRSTAAFGALRPFDDQDEGTVDRFNRSSPWPVTWSTILIDLPLIWMPQKQSRSPVRTHMPFLQP